MKKIFAILFCLVILSFCFVPAVASDPFVTFSEDFSTLKLDNTGYTACDISRLDFEYTNSISSQNVLLSETQKETVRKVNIITNADRTVVNAEITYTNSSIFDVTFLRNDCYEEMFKFLSADYYNIDFSYGNKNVITFHRASLMGEYVTVPKEELMFCDYYDVTSSTEHSFSLFCGYLLVCDENYYYIDLNDIIDASGSREDFSPYDFEFIHAFRVEDKELIEQIDTALDDELFAADFGNLLDEDTTNRLADIFIMFVFCGLPFAAMIVFLIAALRSKTAYKKLFYAIWISCAAELAVFAVLLIILL